MRARLLCVILCFLVAGCAIESRITPLIISSRSGDAFEKTVEIFSQMDYPVEYKEKEEGIIKTGWHTFTLVRERAHRQWPIRIKVEAALLDNNKLRLQPFCEVMQGSIGGTYYIFLKTDDKVGNKAFEQEFNKLVTALSKEFTVQKEISSH